MKKKILRIVSSIFGVCAVCGLSLFSLLDHKKDTQKVSAVSDLIHTNWNMRIDTSDSISNLYFDRIWNYIYTNEIPHRDYPINNNGDDFITWSYNIDYDINGYVQDRYFEKFRIQIQYHWDEAVFQAEGRIIQLFVDTNYHFQQSSLGLYGLVPFWKYQSEKYGTDSPTYSCDYTASSIGFISGDDVSTYTFVLFMNHMAEFIGGNTYTAENIEISQYESTIQELRDLVSSLDSQLASAKTESYAEGYNIGVGVGYDNGYLVGYDQGVDSQQENIHTAYTQGYSDGLSEGSTTDATVATVFSNILLVGMLPVDFFLRILNWEFLGINIASFVSALLSVAATIIVIRIVTGKKE